MLVEQLEDAIRRNDLAQVKAMMTANPALHEESVSALTLAARCRTLEIADWMIANGSDLHQGGHAPLISAWQHIPMLELLTSRGADVNVECWGWFPFIFFACENLEPEPLKWLLDHGANPNCGRVGRKEPGTALDYVISTYPRRPHDLKACIDMLLAAGATTRFDVPVVLDLLRGRHDRVAEQVSADPGLLHARFPQLDFGATGGRLLTLRGATLLHVAAEFGNLQVAKLLLDRGADVNARSTVDANGVGGQTAIFHSATPFDENLSLPMTRLFVERGADLTVRAKLPGHYTRPGEVVDCTALGYAARFADVGNKAATIAFLRTQGAVE